MPSIVLQKALANAGVASRRSSEEYIITGKVSVNGIVVSKLGTRVNPETDSIEVNGKVITTKQELVYFLLNKPKGILSSASDDRGRKTVIDLVDTKTRIVPVGRLDIDTTGLLLLTNDGELTHKLTHPSFKNEKEYQILVEVPQDWEKENVLNVLLSIQKGITIEPGVISAPAKTKILEQVGNSRYILSITIHEGRKHQVRRMVDKVGMSALELKRVRMGSLMLGALRVGEYRPLTEQEVALLKH